MAKGLSRREFLEGATLGAAAVMGSRRSWTAPISPSPNVVFILSDDVGYGDLSCYGATRVKTPHLDQIAGQGIRFLDAHTSASVCTPSRYSLLTGQYAWRNPLGDHILSGIDPLSIPLSQPTLASLFKNAGTVTGLVGKWHLGLGTREHPVDYNQEIAAGPLDLGFDHAFFYPATNDRVPCVYIENRRVKGLDTVDSIQVSYKDKVGNDPTGEEHPELLKIKADKSHSRTIVNGISRIGYMAGGQAARWMDEDMADVLTSQAVSFMEENKDQPFFLLFTPHGIHEPMAPHPRFKGTSECGTRGDAIHELDWCVGQVLAALTRLGLDDKTLIIFSSDNGGAIKDTYDDGTNALHGLQPPNGVLRGHKGTLYEGGHRVPLLARWPGKIRPATESSALIGLVDMMATLGSVAGIPLPDEAGPDSFDVWPAFLGKKGSGRDFLVMQSYGGNGPLALRHGPWKLIEKKKGEGTELYHLDQDLIETQDLASKEAHRAKRLTEKLAEIRNSPATRDGSVVG